MGCIVSHKKNDLSKDLEKEQKEFSLSGYLSKAYVVSVYDGDTIKINMKFGDKIYLWNCRLQGIDTPEIKVKRKGKTKEEIEKLEELKIVGLNAKTYLSNLILHKYIYVKCGKFDKYGRLLIVIYTVDGRHDVRGESNKVNIKDNFESSINYDVMKRYGNAYDGGTKEDFNSKVE